MSQIYHTEPATSGKVVVRTTHGDIDIELWPKEAPLACRNFVQLALEGFYDQTPVHRIVKEFMVQMGDPSGSGSGGESIWGKPFKDEIHGRIKFNHRGQVAMANENKPNSNQSQFFITLGACSWIDRKHTIFGKVTGNTIYNVLRMSEVDCDEKDRPIEPMQILSIEVLWNPFDDIAPRDTKLRNVAAAPPSSSAGQRSERRAVKDTNVLSFGGAEGEEEEEEGGGAAPLPRKDARRPPVEDAPAIPLAPAVATASFEQAMINKILEKRKEIASKAPKRAAPASFPVDEQEPAGEEDAAQKRGKEYHQLREELLRSRRAVQVITGADAERLRQEVAEQKMSSLTEQNRQKHLKRKSDFGDRASDTLSRLQQFRSKLKVEKHGARGEQAKEGDGEGYHGQVLEGRDEGEAAGGAWHAGPLKFRKHIDDAYRNGSRRDDVNDYVVIDPKERR